MRVKLKLFEDDNGMYGLAPDKTIESFDAFWRGATGIFHDVFEHWFEKEHKYFRGSYAMNIAGEVAAMGALAYYVYELGIGEKRSHDGRNFFDEDDIVRQTLYDMMEAMKSGNSNYGNTFECRVPYQKKVDSALLESIIQKHWTKISLYKRGKCDTYCTPTEREVAINYRKTVQLWKLKRLYRWGYRMAERKIPNTYENLEMIQRFITYWNNFTKSHSAEKFTR